MLPKINKSNDSQNDGRVLRENFINAYLQEMQYNPARSTGSVFIFPSLINNAGEISATENASYVDQQANAAEQLQFLMHKVGFNISQLSDLLKVGRPSIYKWLEGADIRRSNLDRLEDLYYIFESWDNKDAVKLGSYLYKKVDGKLSLYDLLSANTIEIERAKELSIKLNHIMLGACDRAAQRRKKLEDAGFPSVSNEQKKKVLDSLIRKS